METLEQQFENALDTITLEGSGQKLMDTEIIHSCLVNNDFAKITLILPEDSSLRKNLPDQVEKVIKNLNGLKELQSRSSRILHRMRKRPNHSSLNALSSSLVERPTCKTMTQ